MALLHLYCAFNLTNYEPQGPGNAPRIKALKVIFSYCINERLVT